VQIDFHDSRIVSSRRRNPEIWKPGDESQQRYPQ